MMESTTVSGALPLPDGRDLAWREAGAAPGWPVLYCHGFPSSAREIELAAAAAGAAGCRLIAPDRPGYGGSSAAPREGFAEWVADAVALLDHLGLATVRVIGVSGGAPHALACAAWRPDRFGPIATVGGLGPLATRRSARGMSLASRCNIALARRRSRVQAALFRLLAAGIRLRPGIVLALLAGSTPPADRAVLRDRSLRPLLEAALRDGVAQGGAAALAELRLFTRPWDFDPATIAAHVALWHGSRDTVVPVRHSRILAAALPHGHLHLRTHQGHYSLPVRHMREILERLP